MKTETTYNSVLTIAGSDSGGCAGIQADIKSISACGAYAASVITATTAQNTVGVFDINPIPIAHVEKQLDAVLSDIKFKAIKIGMLHSCEIIDLVKSKLENYNLGNIVIDPVMVATSGDKLIDKTAIDCLKRLLPLAKIITPNIPEAEILLGYKINENNLNESAKKIGDTFETSVLLKGGHIKSQSDEVFDILYKIKSNKVVTIKNPRIDSNHTHGTGCSLSSSIAAFLAKGKDIELSSVSACRFVNNAIMNGSKITLGKGKGPINHFNLT